MAGLSLKDFCIAHQQQILLAQWDYDKNEGLNPEIVTSASNRIVWWRCENGHEWKAAVYSRTSGRGCPFCAGKRILPGFNDLVTIQPALSAQWHPTKNGLLTPDLIGCGSEKRVWWQCEKGHEWQAAVYSRVAGRGCPYCAGKLAVKGVNDLETVEPQLASEWDADQNGDLTPSSVLPGSDAYVWWRCRMGHTWKASIAHRVKGSGCPYCDGKKVLPGFNDLATLDPEIASQWHPIKNGALTAEMVTRSSNKKAWWQCELGHEWEAVINSRTGGRRALRQPRRADRLQ